MTVWGFLFLVIYIVSWFLPGDFRVWAIVACMFIAVRSLILVLAAPYMPDKENESG